MAFLDALGNAFSGENINRAMGDPRFQLGVGLLGRSHMRPFQALGYTMGDMAASQQMARQQQLQDMQMQMQQAQMAARAQEAEQEREEEKARAQWMQQQGFTPGMPEWAQKLAIEPARQQDPTSLMQNLMAAGLQPGTPEYQKAMMQAVLKPPISITQGPTPPAGYYWKDPSAPQAGLMKIPGGPAEKETEGQLMAQGYAERMRDAGAEMSTLESSGLSPAAISEVAPAALSNVLASPEYQTYRAAQEDWVRAKLRKESGAVIGDVEMEREIKTYFPQIGDKPKTIARKKKQRETAERAMAKSGGDQYYRQYQSAGSGLSESEQSELDELRKRQAPR